ncbi:MAG TPA: Sir2 family NAD-dependent protein deacetylase [Puia sp.]|nr:Sir2 family NAD-dependent protein deacetylase [Puia sp.]
MDKKKLVVLSGAGISAESGLKTFRDSDGLWEGYEVTEVATPGGWKKNPQLVLDFYNQRRKNVLEAKPNSAHYGLAELEKDFDVHIITQNIDDLHERSGSTKVLHLHGEIFKMRSEANTELIYEIKTDIKFGDVAGDGKQLRPHIVWFEEPVPMIESAIGVVRDADIFVVIGTSLVVYPAAGLIHYAAAEIPKFIIDKRIPYPVSLHHITPIEKTASEGVEALKLILQKSHL